MATEVPMPRSKTLRIEWGNTSLMNEYRITPDGGVQYRFFHPELIAGGWSSWRDLSDHEIACHVGFNTAVAEWLKHRRKQDPDDQRMAA